ncbi:MAG TPA: response regulator [Leptospiraceae bacterium]|nr:response regulator [Leptospiraceae bacterium]HMW05541.1 response regulator [Leptospiraceae bacterium]HMX32852.1 response regulator [Leptospiraceae bacterium]HMY31051.1 response regulator [Leptospiraceae bacterium]HMZ67356.1 response regulator [Leptospiraceae bacterium]
MNTEKYILLVEDEPINSHLAKIQLESKNYKVKEVATGEAAIELVLNLKASFDLILMDIDLGPGMDGTQTAEKILSKINIPILFYSSHTEPEIIEKTEKITSYGICGKKFRNHNLRRFYQNGS